MNVWLALTILVTTAHAGPIGPACDARIRAAARRAHGADGELKFFDEGITTALARDNWTSAKFAFGDPRETRVYLISARQLDAAPDCRVASSVLIETRVLGVDRGPDARRLAGTWAPDGLWRALEAIDLEYPRLARPFARATVSLVGGTPAAAIDEALTFSYRLGWGACAARCEFEHVLTVRYARGFTAPRIQIVAESGDPLPSAE